MKSIHTLLATIHFILNITLVTCLGTPGYIYSPFAPTALFQQAMNLSFISGQFSFYQEQAGYGSNGVYNGVLGIAFDRTENFAFLTSADGKKIRKLNYRTTFVGSDISGTRDQSYSKQS